MPTNIWDVIEPLNEEIEGLSAIYEPHQLTLSAMIGARDYLVALARVIA